MGFEKVVNETGPKELRNPRETMESYILFGGGFGIISGLIGLGGTLAISAICPVALIPGICVSALIPGGFLVGCSLGAIAGWKISKLLDFLGFEADPTTSETTHAGSVLWPFGCSKTDPGRHRRWRKAGRAVGGVIGGLGIPLVLQLFFD